MSNAQRLGVSRALWWRGMVALATLGLVVFGVVGGTVGVRAAAPPAADLTVFAGGLDGPRGLAFGPDGNLYVAESGPGGTNSTDGQCEQVIRRSAHTRAGPGRASR